MTRRLLAVGMTAALAVAAPAATGQPAPPQREANVVAQYILPGDRVFPEGIAVRGQAFYVSSTTDGTIFRGTRGGRRASVFLPGGADGRSTAVGVRVAGQRLYIAGGATGSVWVYSTRTKQLLRRFDTGSGGFLNDVAVVNGHAYVTDSRRPHIYRITRGQVAAGRGDTVPLQPWIDNYPEFDPAAFNANGIVSRGSRELIYVQTGAGKLWRIDRASRAIRPLPTSAPVTNGDGLVRHGRRLYVVRNALNQIATVDLRNGRVLRTVTSASFKRPTTAARLGARLLVVNSQFDRRTGTPELPFTVAAVRVRDLR